MAKSLQDQLLKAGLVDKKKAKQIKQSKRKHARQQPKGHAQPDEIKLRVQQTIAEKAEHDREINRQRRQASEGKVIAAQIKQLIEQNRLDRVDGEIGHQFVDQQKVKKLYMTKTQQDQLARGQLTIVRLNEQYELVPHPVAEKIRTRDPLVVLKPPQEQQFDADDPYVDYKIPDDLMW